MTLKEVIVEMRLNIDVMRLPETLHIEWSDAHQPHECMSASSSSMLMSGGISMHDQWPAGALCVRRLPEDLVYSFRRSFERSEHVPVQQNHFSFLFLSEAESPNCVTPFPFVTCLPF